MDWAAELLRIGGLSAVPLALLVALWSRWPGTRPATRHAMWTAVLLSFVLPGAASLIWRPTWFQSSRVLAGADRALGQLQANLQTEAASAPATKEIARAPTGREQERGHEPRIVSDLPRRAEALDRGYVSPITPAFETMSPAEWARGVREPVATERRLPAAAALERSVSRTAPADLGPGISGYSLVHPANEARVPTDELPAGAGGRTAPPPAGSPSVNAGGPSAGSAAPVTDPVAQGLGDWTARWSAEVREWVAGALVVRDALAQVPPLPLAVWGAGALVLSIMAGVKVVSVRRMVGRARGASAETCALVAACAEEIGLRRVPETLIIGERISPMVWCGARPRVVLPAGLWRELDDDSRRAVVLHELAHVKRRDHWLCWFAAAVGVAYWWHPVAWWARRRVRDEADASCDAWVTSLMPGSRRAYAEALVTAKWFVSCTGQRVPRGLAVCSGGALGAVSGRTKHLARRLKMVMTQRVAPKSSVAGAVMSLAVLATGMVVMPGLACPPEEQAARAAAQAGQKAERAAKAGAERARAAEALAKVNAERAKMRADKAAAKSSGQGGGAGGGQGGLEFFGEAPALEAMRRGQSGGGDEEQNLRRLEERLRMLEQHLQKMHPGQQAPGAGGMSTAPMGAGGGGMSVYVAPRAGQAIGLSRFAPGAAPAAVVVDDQETVVREYLLPEGKLEALTELMAREDVPVLIERHDDKIVLHAPESKQRVFAAFVNMINPGATQQQPEAFPGGASEQAVRVYRDAMRSHEAMRADQAAQMEDLKRQQKDMERQQRDMERQRRDVERKAERARQRSENTEQEIDEMRQRIDQIGEERSSAEGEARAARLEAEAQRLAARIEAKAADMTALIEQAVQSENMQGELDSALERLEAAIEEIASQIEAQVEQLMEQGDDGDEEAILATPEAMMPVGGMTATVAAPPAAPTPTPVSVGAPALPAMPAMPALATPPAPAAPAAAPAAPTAPAPATPAPAQPAAPSPPSQTTPC